MDSREKELLASLRGPNDALKADAKRYMVDSVWRAQVDAADAKEGTQLGRTLKSIFMGKPVDAPTPQTPPAQPTAIELAAACKQFPKARCLELFKRPANQPGEIASNLSKADYKTALIAATFFKVLNPDDRSSVRFNYETSGQRRAKREATDAAAKAQAEALPPGIHKNEKGELSLVDEAAFTAWKASKSANKDAIEYLESVAS